MWNGDQHEIPKEAVLKRTLLSFLSDESGATAIEYGLIAAGISLAIITVAPDEKLRIACAFIGRKLPGPLTKTLRR